MMNSLSKPIAVDVEVAGQSYSGSYTLDGGVVIARWNGWNDSTQAGAGGAEITAKSLVLWLVRRFKDAD